MSFALECGLPETSNYLTPSPTVWSSIWMSFTQTFSPLPFSSLLFLYHGQALPFLTPTFQPLDGLLDQDSLQFLESVSCLQLRSISGSLTPDGGDLTLSPWSQPWTLPSDPTWTQGTVAAWISPGLAVITRLAPIPSRGPSYSVH